MKMIDFEYQVEWVARKTLGIAVQLDGSVHVRAPLGTERGQIERRLLARSDWIKRQIDYFQGFNPRSTPRSYVAGESHLFLGKSYRLKILDSSEKPVTLQSGWLMVSTSDLDPMTIKILLQQWYRNQAKRIFPPLLEREWKRAFPGGGIMPRLVVKTMGRRWGSLSRGGILTLNLDLIRAPRHCVEYVLCHELCHLEHRDHGPEFYARLSRLMPDWEKRKARLESTLK